MRLLGLVALTLTSTLSLFLCPYSKVEESFNVQATHDLFYNGIGPVFANQEMTIATYDHLRYGGVVPRTFFGALVISTLLQISAFVLRPIVVLENHPLVVQSLARFFLLLFNINAHYRLATAANSKFGSRRDFRVGGFFLLLTASQFHIPFYASRMLPNTFALMFVTHSYADWLESKISRAVVLMVFCTVVFRCDVLILLFTFGITLLIRREISIFEAVKTGFMTVITSLLLSVPFDSIMWQRLLWPEGEVLLFNTVENKSNEYGVSPWYWYVAKALPKGLMLTIFLVPFAFVRFPERLAGFKVGWLDVEGLPYIIPVIGFISLYSILPHKEIRFIFISFPMFTVMASKGLVRIYDTARLFWSSNSVRQNHRNKFSQSLSSKLVLLILCCGSFVAMALSFIVNMIFIQVSKRNYPGGDGLAALSELIKEEHPSSEKELSIFIDVASAMTGVSLFGQRVIQQNCPATQCNIIKDGYEKENGISRSSQILDFMLTEERDVKGFEIKKTVQGFPRIDYRQARIVTDDSIFVLKRKRNTNS